MILIRISKQINLNGFEFNREEMFTKMGGPASLAHFYEARSHHRIQHPMLVLNRSRRKGFALIEFAVRWTGGENNA